MQARTASPIPQEIIFTTKMTDERLIEHAKQLVNSREGKISKNLLAQLIKLTGMPDWELLYDRVLNGSTDWYKCNTTDIENNWRSTVLKLLEYLGVGSRVSEEIFV